MKWCLVPGLALAVAAAGGDALAQRPSPYKPAPAVPQQLEHAAPPPAAAPRLPWERDAERFINPPTADPVAPAIKKLYEDPLAKIYRDPVAKAYGDPLAKIYGDPIAKLGLPPNVSPSSLAPPARARAEPSPEFNRLDGNGDGILSRREYMNERTRTPPVLGPQPSLRRQALNSRNTTRFRHADRNGDGFVTPDEHGAAPNARF